MGKVLGAFPVGANPQGICFDGTNMWITAAFGDNVNKLRASDGAVLGTFAVGMEPIFAAFDGANIWVANEGSGTATKLRASDGALLGTFTVGTTPRGVAFDGTNVWVTNSGSKTVSQVVSLWNREVERALKPHRYRRFSLLQQRTPLPLPGSASGANTTAAATRSPGSKCSSRNALRCVASRFANGGRVHADDFAVVADQHDFGGFVHLGDADDFADALGGLHVDDAFAAAIGAIRN